MNKIPFEEKLVHEWELNSSQKIVDKIFENHTDTSTLIQVLEGEILVACSYALGKILALESQIKPAQLRRIYEAFLNIKTYLNVIKNRSDADEIFQSKIKNQIMQLKPQLAYAVKRQEKQVRPFYDVINPLIDLVYDISDYERLCQFIEATVAYHKYFG